MKNNTMLLYVIIGLLSAVLLVTLYCSGGFTKVKGGHRAMQSGTVMHQMPDGSMMRGEGEMDMNSMMVGMMAKLDGKTGGEFDKTFLEEMIVHHQGAVVMAEAVLKNSKRPELIKLANDIISAQTKEIETMKDWQKSWFLR